MELTSRLVEVPMSVQTPPNCDAYESGIKNREAGAPLLALAASTMGRKIATAAVLLMKAETAQVTAISATTSRNRWPASRPSPGPSHPIAPVCRRPALSTNIAATVSVAGLLKPATPSSIVIQCEARSPGIHGITSAMSRHVVSVIIATRAAG